VNIITPIWNHLGDIFFFLTNYERTLGTLTVGAYIASFFTLSIFLSRGLNARLSGGRWDFSIAQGLISSSWVFPMLYLPYQGTPYWLTLLFSITMWMGSWLLLRNITSDHRRRPSPKSHRHRK